MAVSLMGIPVADEPKDSVMRKEADASDAAAHTA